MSNVNNDLLTKDSDAPVTMVSPALSSLVGGARWQDLVAGLSGGLVSTLSVHPLDLAKIRLQVNEGTGKVAIRPPTFNLFSSLQSVFRQRGFFGLYQGLSPNLVGAGSAWGLYFFFYDALKRNLQKGDSTHQLGTLTYFASSASAGAVTLFFTNPIWVAKTRLCLQYEQLTLNQQLPPLSGGGTALFRHDGSGNGSGSGRGRGNGNGIGQARVVVGPTSLPLPTASMSSVLVDLWRKEGVRGLYRGFVPGLFGVSHGAITFMLYESLRNGYNAKWQRRPIDTKLTTFEYLAFSSLSKLVAVCITYPYQVVRSRLQDQHRSYDNARHVLREIYAFEGLSGLYKGLTASLVRVVPACAITFVVYENVKQALT